MAIQRNGTPKKCETWQLTTNFERRLLCLEMDFWRRSAGRDWKK